MDADAHEIIPGIFLGNQKFAHDIHMLGEMKISHIINMAEEVPDLFPDQITYKHFYRNDCIDDPIIETFKEAHIFLDQALQNNKRVLIHCYAGISRSSTMVGSYLIKKYGLSAEKAIEYMKQIRPIVSPNNGFRRQLEQFEKTGYPSKFSFKLEELKSSLTPPLVTPSKLE